MSRNGWLFIAPALLVGVPSAAADGPKLRALLEQFRGQPLSAAITKLGLPSAKMDIPAATIYSWHIGNVFVGDDPLECTVRLSVDGAGLIGQNDVDGNKGACDLFVRKLR